MILVDTALERLEQTGNPIRVGLVGTGHVGRHVLWQIERFTAGMKVVAVYNRTRSKAEKYCLEASGTSPLTKIDGEHLAIADTVEELCSSPLVDVVVDATGAIEFGAQVALAAINAGKVLVEINAELDATVGPILKKKADETGAFYTGMDGDQPGVAMNIYRMVKSMGLRPVLYGNIKGFLGRQRTPDTQEGFARDWELTTTMATSYADGTKVAFEQAEFANATGMGVAVRGMLGPEVFGADAAECMKLFPLEEALAGPGYVDYILDGKPGPGVFIIAHSADPRTQFELEMLKMGTGPFYCFTRPYHLCGFEIPSTIARAVCFNDAVLTPIDRPYVEVVATAKRDLEAGETLDEYGGYTAYGLAENAEIVQDEALLPIGLAKGCRLKRAVKRDEVLTFADVDVPDDTLIHQLYREQQNCFSPHLQAQG